MNCNVNNENTLPRLFSLGVLRSSAGFPFEHPMELVKLKAQAHPALSTWQIVNQMLRSHGIFGFTETALTNFPKRVLKEAVSWPVIWYAHEHIVTTFPRTFTREGTASKLFTGASVALFDSTVILPLEQLMAFRVKERKEYSAFFKGRFSREGILSLYRGVKINLIRQGVIWGTYMGFNNECKRLFDIYDKDKVHPYLRQGITSLFISTGVISWGLPLDFIKSRIQMDKELQSKKLLSVSRTLIRRHGFKGFYAGALPVFVHTIFHATIGGYILDHIFSSKSN